jgi:hypothetical protein
MMATKLGVNPVAVQLRDKQVIVFIFSVQALFAVYVLIFGFPGLVPTFFPRHEPIQYPSVFGEINPEFESAVRPSNDTTLYTRRSV